MKMKIRITVEQEHDFDPDDFELTEQDGVAKLVALIHEEVKSEPWEWTRLDHPAKVTSIVVTPGA